MAKTQLPCPCGKHIVGRDEDDLVELAQAHLAQAHPDRHYAREDILLMAF